MHVVNKNCPGCGKCTHRGICPTGAIKIENNKAIIGPECIDCGLCIPVCPIGVINKQESSKEDTQEITQDAKVVDKNTEVTNNESEQTSTGV